MGYYADLIKQKQERQNAKVFSVPGTVRELKTRAEVERYMFEQRREVDKCISWMESTKKKIQEIEKEPKPHSIGWAERLGRAQSSYKQYKRWMEMHEDFAARAEDWLSKNRNSKDNSKEEKDNNAESHLKGLIGKKFKRDSDLERAVNGSIYTEISDWSHPRMIVFDKYTDEKFYVTTADNNKYGKDKEFWISRVEKANAKEEKDNASVQDRFRYKGCMITILKKGENQYTFSVEQNGREEGSNKVYPSQDKAESEAKREVEVNWNEKEETKDKENASAEDSEKIKRQIVSVEAYLKDRLEWQKSVNKEVEGCQRELARLKKMLGNNNSKEEEKSYYAKLAEEKAAKKNAKSWRVEFLGNSHYIETIADAESAQSKAQRDLAIKERQLSQQGEEIRQEYWEFSQQIRKIEKEIESQKKK